MTIAIANVRRAPRHDAELSNQLLLGEAVRVEAERGAGEWLRIAGLDDGYRGWTRGWGLRRVSERECRAWLAASRPWFGAPAGELCADPGGAMIGPVFLGSRFRPGRQGRRGLPVRLPDGGRARLRTRARSSGRSAMSPARLRRRLAAWIGAPYLWGGRTMAGVDCSGLTQLVFAEFGIRLPRDAKDQFRAVRRLAPGQPVRLGDLAFFGRPGEPVSHVGIMLDRCSFVHARGVVQVASLDPVSPLNESKLSRQLRGFGRPAGSGISGSEAARRRPESP